MKLDDLISQSENQTPTYTWWLEFDVISAVDNEKKAAKEIEKKSLSDYLSKRSDMRKALRTWQQTTGNKDADKKSVNTSALADTFTEIMVNMGKDPKYMQETYWTSQWNLDLINKMKGIQWGKFSWDIQNYIDGRSDDLTWLVNNMFPDYVAKKTWAVPQVQAATEVKETSRPLTSDTRSWWDKMAEKVTQFRWSDIWLESEKQPIRWLANILGWFIDTTQKIIPWSMDIFNQLTMTSPEKFNQYLDEWYYMQDWVKKNAKEAYDRAVKYQWYKWNYNQWVEDSKKSYTNLYNMSTSSAKSVDEWRWDWWFNTMDEESWEFKAWEIGSEVWQQIVLDRWLTKALWEWVKLYKWYKGVKWAEDAAKWTELAMRWTELATKWAEATADTTKTLNESKGVAKRIIDWFNKEWAWQRIAKETLWQWKAWLEYTLIWDVQDGKLSDAQAYWINAAIASLFWTVSWIIGAGWRAVVEPQEKLRTSLQRLWVEDIDDIIAHSEAASKDATMKSSQQMVIDEAVWEAKENVKRKMGEVWENLGNFRKKLWWSDIKVDDFKNTINKSLTKKWVWAQIVERDGKYVIEWYPWEYWEIMTKIVDRMNSAIENVKNKYNLLAAWEEVELWSNTSVFEDLLSDLKGFSIKEQNAEVRQKFYEIEQDLLEDLKKNMSEKEWNTYDDYLKQYAELKNRYNKVWELEQKMSSNNLAKQPKMEDWQYLSDFLDELYENKDISSNAKDRRVAAIFADSIYNVPIKESDKVMYPSFNWFRQEVERALVRLFRNPRWKLTWWWRSYWKNYVPSKWRQAVKNVIKRWKEATIWEIASQPEEEA